MYSKIKLIVVNENNETEKESEYRTVLIDFSSAQKLTYIINRKWHPLERFRGISCRALPLSEKRTTRENEPEKDYLDTEIVWGENHPRMGYLIFEISGHNGRATMMSCDGRKEIRDICLSYDKVDLKNANHLDYLRDHFIYALGIDEGESYQIEQKEAMLERLVKTANLWKSRLWVRD